MGNDKAFKPLGVYINFFQPTIPSGTTREFTVMMVNDETRPQKGQLTLALETKSGGKLLARSQQAFDLSALGSQSYSVSLAIPHVVGESVLKAVATAEGQRAKQATVSRRWLSVTE